MKPKRLIYGAAMLAALCLASTARATIRVWSGNASMDNKWSNPANWQNGAPVAGDDLQFPLGASHPNNSDDYANGTTLNSITFIYGGGGGANGYTLSGNSIALNAGISAVNNSSLGFMDNVNNALILNSNQTFSVGGMSDLLYLHGAINLNGKNLNFDVASTSEALMEAVISGAGALSKSSPGTLFLYSNNTYTGSTTLNGGTLEIDGSQSASPLLLNAGTLTGKGTVGTLTSTGSGGAGSIVLDPGGTFSTMTCSDVSLNPATTFTANLFGSGFNNQLNVHGSVALNNATLSISLGSTPAVGQGFIIIANDGADPVSGTFSGLPEGAIFSVGGLLFQITYAGFDGNDVMLTRYGLRTVTNTADSGAGSLRDTLAAAADGDTINFAPNVTGAITLTSGTLLVDKSITILGPGPATLALNGYGAGRVFVITNGVAAAISGLTITNGLGLGSIDGVGAGIYNDHSTLTVSNCVISDNHGQGIYNNGQSGSAVLRLSGCTIARHKIATPSGGGIGNDGYSGSAVLTMTNCTVHNNQSAQGGGLMNASGMLTMVNCTVCSNISSGTGGLMNTAGTGGNATLKVFASTFSGNSGGAIFNNAATGGSATLEIGGTLLQQAGPPAVTIVNVGSTAVTSDGYNLSNDNASGVLTQATDQTNTDPLLGPLADNGGPTPTQPLLWGSPAIDKGKSFGLTTDQRGLPRPYDFSSLPNATGGDGSDIGAVEFVPPAPLLSIAALSNAVQLQGAGLSNLTYTLRANTNVNTTNWLVVGSALANGAGSFTFTDTNAPLYRSRFYRASYP